MNNDIYTTLPSPTRFPLKQQSPEVPPAVQETLTKLNY